MAEAEVAIVIPVFRHSVLLVEAIESALGQSLPCAVVLVNDGCPHPETDETCRTYARAYPDRITYLKKENGGLSSARNHGIAHVLAHLPDVRAIYMLDADNRLRPLAMERALAALEASDAGWIYPDIDMLGLSSGHDYSGPYSVLLHTAMNTCEAGSLIRRAVFEAGVRFDTSFTSGFEDWDFFLSAAEAGFRGRNIEGFGFLYRKRPESMLADSERDRAPILSRLRAKHRALFSPREMVGLEQAEAPRYAFVLTDLNEVWLTTDPMAEAQILTPADYALRFWQARFAPGRFVLAPLVVVTTSEALGELASLGLIHGILWRLELLADQCVFAGLGVQQGAQDRMGLRLRPDAARALSGAAMVLTSAETLRAATGPTGAGWLNDLLSRGQSQGLAEALLPQGATCQALEKGGAMAALLDLIAGLRESPLAAGALALTDWREPDLQRRAASHLILRNRLGRQPVPPILRGQGRHLGLLLSIVEFGGVEKVALNLARAFAARGWQVHLYILGPQEAAVTSEWRQTLASITFLADGDFAPWGGGTRTYFGNEIPRWATAGNHPRLIALLHWLDAVIDLHSGAAVAVMGQLRRLGVVTVSSLHLVDISAMGRASGNPFLTLAYEHAFDLIAPCSQTLGDWLHAMGIPEDKIVAVPNAPGFPPVLPLQPRNPGPLRALFLGRLDAQKGLERLAEVIARSAGLQVHWRVIGKPVLTQGAPALAPQVQAVLEPPLSTPQELAQALAQADVLVLLSDYEGLPLTVLEAMRQGVVPIATDVGAVGEVVQDGQTGCLLPLDSAVEACLGALTWLAGDPDALARLSQAAVQAMAGRDWSCVTENLSQAIDRIAATRQVTLDHDIAPPDPEMTQGALQADAPREDVTPAAWVRLRDQGLDPPRRLQPYEALDGLFQYGAPDNSGVVVDLHATAQRRADGRSGHVISAVPQGRRQPWFTYELLLADIDLTRFLALDWTVRLDMPIPRNLFAQFMLDGPSDHRVVDLGTLRGSDSGRAITLSLGLHGFAQDLLARLNRVRLVLSTDGEMLPIDLVELLVEGRT